MKHVIYLGKVLRVPDYANYVATDSDGECHGYRGKPIVLEHRGEWDERHRASNDEYWPYFLGCRDLTEINLDWRNTCKRVESLEVSE